jgi:hypothetical protein
MVATTENFIANRIGVLRISDNNLLAFGNHLAISDTSIMGRTSSAPAESFNLQWQNSIGKFNEPSRTWEEFRSKISQDSKGIDIDSKPINYLGKFFDLLGIKELRLIANDEIDAFTAAEHLNYKFMEV